MGPHSRRNDPAVHLYWLPLGAGARCARWNGWLYEAVVAWRERRTRRDLYHAALELEVDGGGYVIEVGPVWDGPAVDRGAVGEGPVGMAWLGRSRWFRYEIRCWGDGLIPDVAHAVDSPVRLPTDTERAARLLGLVPAVPIVTWGRDQLRTGEMWNSNSVVSWLLSRSGHAADTLSPPANGRAPGWSAGLIVAARQDPLQTAVPSPRPPGAW